ncbi:hypothetical protein K488DRAFT_91233 [Vararia minispora EC-137]|uniref:Uncharacterized protein n=1 Tax=Vararia minispora EC-137 TaxID=1314806 RepID=A0ACB8Q669_9AGAM|nr:hypothetical protein K488DRAFT_91233 [Vararia minispora EC-137]
MTTYHMKISSNDAPIYPITPPASPPLLADVFASVQATPINALGSSTDASSDVYSSRNRQLGDRVQNDLLRKRHTVELDKLVSYWVCKVADAGLDDGAKGDCYDCVLRAVLPVCRELQKQDLLEKYCNARPQGSLKHEKALYEPLVDLCNKALNVLRNLEIDASLGEFKFRRCSDLDILFHRSAERVIKGRYSSGAETQQKPDIVITSRRAAARSYDYHSTSNRASRRNLKDKIFEEVKQRPPDHNGGDWRAVLCPVGVKRKYDRFRPAKQKYGEIALQQDILPSNRKQILKAVLSESP